MSGAAQLADALRAEGGLLADALRGEGPPAAGEPREPSPGPAPADREEPLLAAVPPGPYALTLAAVREGYLLHYGEGRVTDVADPDLALLGGDRLYALGLAELAALGDLDAVVTLADLISACARAHADDDPAQAAAAWTAAVTALSLRV